MDVLQAADEEKIPAEDASLVSQGYSDEVSIMGMGVIRF
jgi:hypothetical protein